MLSSMEQVLDVLNGWKDDARIVAVLFTSPKEDSIKLGGIIIDASRTGVRISSGDADVVIRFTSNVTFDWQAPKRDRTGLPPESLYDSFLQVRSPDFLCVLSAFKLKTERVDT